MLQARLERPEAGEQRDGERGPEHRRPDPRRRLPRPGSSAERTPMSTLGESRPAGQRAPRREVGGVRRRDGRLGETRHDATRRRAITPSTTTSAPTPRTWRSMSNPVVQVGDAGEPDGHQRRHEDRHDERDDRGGDTDHDPTRDDQETQPVALHAERAQARGRHAPPPRPGAAAPGRRAGSCARSMRMATMRTAVAWARMARSTFGVCSDRLCTNPAGSVGQPLDALRERVELAGVVQARRTAAGSTRAPCRSAR